MSLAGRNPLADYYSGIPNTAFQLQLHIIFANLSQMEIIGGVLDSDEEMKVRIIERGLVSARNIFTPFLFHMGEISAGQYCLIKQVYNLIRKTEHARAPCFTIYLETSPEISLERVKKRGRACESSITIEYLKRLNYFFRKFYLCGPQVTNRICRIDANDDNISRIVSEIESAIVVKLLDRTVIRH